MPVPSETLSVFRMRRNAERVMPVIYRQFLSFLPSFLPSFASPNLFPSSLSRNTKSRMCSFPREGNCDNNSRRKFRRLFYFLRLAEEFTTIHTREVVSHYICERAGKLASIDRSICRNSIPYLARGRREGGESERARGALDERANEPGG